MIEAPPSEIFLPAELEEHIRKHVQEFLARAVESAAKPGFAVKCMAEINLCAFREYRGDIDGWWCVWKNGRCTRLSTCCSPPKND